MGTHLSWYSLDRLLYYFNFVQTEYVKVADPDAKADVMKNNQCALWFRWAAFNFLTGLYLCMFKNEQLQQL